MDPFVIVKVTRLLSTGATTGLVSCSGSMQLWELVPLQIAIGVPVGFGSWTREAARPDGDLQSTPGDPFVPLQIGRVWARLLDALPIWSGSTQLWELVPSQITTGSPVYGFGSGFVGSSWARELAIP